MFSAVRKACGHPDLPVIFDTFPAFSETSMPLALCQKFKDGRTNVHDEERSGRPSVITDDLMQAVEAKIHENRRFTITTLSLGFPTFLGRWCIKLGF
ncbi:hypothetical protein TNCV_641711 [Trichonephila clavipes]|nr:hypothetical protein TNCV_641711 [Trichonephila clavipes]